MQTERYKNDMSDYVLMIPPAGKYPFSNGVYHSCGWGEFLKNEPIYQTCMAVGNPVSTVND
jgi:hypothetical protein